MCESILQSSVPGLFSDNIIFFIAWTLISGFVGALLGAAGNKLGTDIYAFLSDQIRKYRFGYNYTDSQLVRKSNRLSGRLKEWSLELEQAKYGTPQEYEIWKEYSQKYESCVFDEIIDLAEDFKERGTYPERTVRQAHHVRQLFGNLDIYEGKWQQGGGFESFITPPHTDYELEKIKEFRNQRETLHKALEGLATTIDDALEESNYSK